MKAEMDILLKYKKVFLFIGLTIVAITIGYLIYFLFFFNNNTKTQSTKTTSTTKTQNQISTLPESKTENKNKNNHTQTKEKNSSKNINQQNNKKTTVTSKISDLNNSASLGITIDQDQKSLKYYNQNDGKFYKIDENGKIIELSKKIFHDVSKVNWQPGQNKAIIEYPDGSNIIYDFDKDKQTVMPKHWDAFKFSPDGKNIVLESIGLDPNNHWLVVTDNNGENTKIIEKIGINTKSLHTGWSPNKKIIAMYTKGRGLDRQEVFFVGQNNENFKSMTIEGRGFQSIWSPNGEKLLYSIYSTNNNLKPKLWIVDASPGNIGNDRKSLDINTWAKKCVFINNTEIYCGVPKNLKNGSGLFPELAENTTDELYKINIETGKRKKVPALNKKYNISEIIISQDKKSLYFTDKLTHIIHKVELQ